MRISYGLMEAVPAKGSDSLEGQKVRASSKLIPQGHGKVARPAVLSGIERGNTMKARGYEIWRGPSHYTREPIVVVAILASDNAKTGDMVQVYILPQKWSHRKHNPSPVCGNCPIRTSCYVVEVWGPGNVWKAWKRGAYPMLPINHRTFDKPVRLGAWGDPATMPDHILQTILDKATHGWTGYTHGMSGPGTRPAEWNRPVYKACMISTETLLHAEFLQRLGYRTFRILREGEPTTARELLCRNYTGGLQCKDCKLCDGLVHNGAKSITIPIHGFRKGNFK